MSSWQTKAMIAALWAVAYGLLAWTLASINGVQQDLSGIRATLARLERDGQEFVLKREFDIRVGEVNRRLEIIERGR